MSEVIQFPGRAPPTPKEEDPAGVPNPALIEQVELLLEWCKKGDVVAAAFVLVYAGDRIVGNGYVDIQPELGGRYHELTSGAATLLTRLSISECDDHD